MNSASRTETKTLKVGDLAPDFTLQTEAKEDWTLSNFRGKKNVVLAFFPFAFSSVCSVQMPSYEGELEKFRENGAEVVGISMDSTFALDAWKKLINTTFPLLSDFYPQGKVTDLYGVRHPAGMAERAVFVIDKEGVIRHIEVTHTPGELPDKNALLDAVDALG
ncbi:peroxiredoxin (alkyl hydroperoxide reductase subunit C) [Thermosporothrix hazakensis]|jgi:peroxiredoxin (alkyl hydroperoxide reductase subunit C)|uniref:Peroxiredoxin (Alkyl hydroperoxide reductase subunit C) n=2 Tax=Thermosporothrix TaxID=768650 RepID=A0A326TW55_THEHA|nr:peroxiredoxin [Thermosporothrix hazakensis]PZW21065.1 peroxiredoxin (alkyl hydroperoxide reductase subunit C) [Thermosporothrix hazakensis]BBH88197.1 peroxiredoxin [Thermosporothrix sp. COM3]GCE46385.1 peroxiredoxin [Thermosporothrix hazakensis]